nr:FdtA/QdtA family cupin domain-containing protein [uncultured Blautia sp.]
MSLEQKCPVFQFSVKGDERGSMIVIEGGVDIPFDIKRMFYIYGSDTSVIRGQHANRESEFILINVHGTSKVKLRDGEEERIVVLDTPMKGVYIPRMVWKDMYDFSEDSVLLVLASTHYTADEYVRNFGDYVSEVAAYK